MVTLLFGTIYLKREMIKDIDALTEFYHKRKEALDRHGVDTKFLACADSLLKSWVNTGALIGERFPDMTLKLSPESMTKEAYFQLIRWPRDAFNIFDNTAYVDEKYSSAIPKVLDAIRPGLECVVSEIGEQGLSVKIDSLLFGTALKGLDWEVLKKHGVKVLPAFYPYTSRYNILERFLFSGMRPNGHIDTFVNGISYSGSKALFVSRNYNFLYKKVLDKIVKKFGMQKEVISRKEDLECCGINFVQLSDGAVMLPDKAHQTIDKLAKYLPQDKIIPLPILPNECEIYDGLRCMTNIIP